MTLNLRQNRVNLESWSSRVWFVDYRKQLGAAVQPVLAWKNGREIDGYDVGQVMNMQQFGMLMNVMWDNIKKQIDYIYGIMNNYWIGWRSFLPRWQPSTEFLLAIF